MSVDVFMGVGNRVGDVYEYKSGDACEYFIVGVI